MEKSVYYLAPGSAMPLRPWYPNDANTGPARPGPARVGTGPARVGPGPARAQLSVTSHRRTRQLEPESQGRAWGPDGESGWRSGMSLQPGPGPRRHWHWREPKDSESRLNLSPNRRHWPCEAASRLGACLRRFSAVQRRCHESQCRV